MPSLEVNGVELFYEVAGDPADPAILLIAGLGVQMIDWPDYFVDPFIEAGHFVVRFDNRDIGLSTTFDGAPNDPQAVVDALTAGQEPDLAYTLGDMAADAAGLLDALSIEAAHLIGVSMGGMIAQTTALNHSAKVLSLTSIMSSTGAADVGAPSPEAMAAILSPAPSAIREEVIDHNMASATIWASPDHFDAERLRALFEAAWDRTNGTQLANAGRHFCAIVASPPRDEALADLSVPALVVHGTADTLINSSGGQRTANCIPSAELLLIDGMGHDLQPAFTPAIIESVTTLIARSAN